MNTHANIHVSCCSFVMMCHEFKTNTYNQLKGVWTVDISEVCPPGSISNIALYITVHTVVECVKISQ